MKILCVIQMLCLALPLTGQRKNGNSNAFDQAYRLVSKEQPQTPIKCGFPEIAALHFAGKTDPEARAHLQAILARPSLPEFYITPDSRFRIHYTTSGSNAVDPTSTTVPGVPDYVYEAGIAVQKSYALLVDSLGMKGHADDGGVDGPEFDFYIQNLGNLFGATFFDFSRGAGPAYIQLNNDYDPSIFFTDGFDALRVTVAHEYFHAVQLNYFLRVGDVFIF